MHAASGLFSWSMELFASRLFPPKMLDDLLHLSFRPVFPRVSERRGRSRPLRQAPFIRTSMYFPSRLLSPPFYSSSLSSRNSDPGSQSRLFFPLPTTYGARLAFSSREAFSIFASNCSYTRYYRSRVHSTVARRYS